MVVVVHVVGPALLGSYPDLRTNTIYRSATYGNYGVQIFFVVSGLCVVQAALATFERPRGSEVFRSGSRAQNLPAVFHHLDSRSGVVWSSRVLGRQTSSAQ